MRLARSLRWLCLLVLAFACSDNKVSCPRTVAAYCAAQPAAAACVERAYPTAMAAACKAPRTTTDWQAVGTCEGYQAIFAATRTSPALARYYDGQTGALIAIVSSIPGPDGERCLAGPGSFALPSCDDPSADSCPRPDGGSDGAAGD
jgi:hypothetical protein